MKKILILSLVIFALISCKKEEKKIETETPKELTAMQKNLGKYVNVKLTSDLSKLTDNERK